MSKLDENLRILQILVESAGGSIEPVRHLLRRNHEDITAEDDAARLKELLELAIDGFFHCAARNITFTELSRIEEFCGRTLEENYPGVSPLALGWSLECGRTLEENYPGASPTFMKLARTYWTFKLILIECTQEPSVCATLLGIIDINFAGLFFPTPGISPPKELREETMRTLIEQSGAELDVEDFIRGNFYLR